MDKVTIILPVYGVADYLERALDSLIGQTYKNLEIIPVDDSSPDNCREILIDYEDKYDFIKPIYFDENRGVSAARNAALEKMSGDWICFCDGDDWYDERFVEKMLEAAKTHEADYVICDYFIAADSRVPFRAGSLGGAVTGGDNKREIASGSLSSCTKLISRALFERAGVLYPVGMKQSEELPVLPVWAKFAKKIAVVDEPLYYYYQRVGGGSASNTATRDTEKVFCEALALLKERIGEGYERELETRAIYALFYGEILKKCKLKATAKEIKAKIIEYESAYPDYKNNPYIGELGFFKRVFLSFAGARFVLGLRLLSLIHSMLIH